jgi:glycosyltransferase involved in cell wall biosynthesis
MHLKLALLSHVLPPAWSGQAVVIYRLLTGLDPNSYCLISRHDYASQAHPESFLGRLPGSYHCLPTEPEVTRGYRWGLAKWWIRFNTLVGLLVRAWRLAAIVRRQHCTAIVACTGDLLDPPAAYIASRLSCVPFYLYAFDYYSYQWTEPFARSFARHIEPVLLKGAMAIVVPNEFLRDELNARYSAGATVIHNPSDPEPFTEGHEVPWPQTNGEMTIVFTGAVYHANYDAFRNLMAALERLAPRNAKLHIYTAQDPSALEREGIRGPVVYHGHVAPAQIMKVQRDADILFLPLALDSTIPEVIRTSAPGKMGDYLASGRPILAHAPQDSYVSWYFTTHQCGALVTTSDPEELVRAIVRIADDPRFRKQVQDNARICAAEDFSAPLARTKFLEVLRLAREASL